jgi:ketose-bisphosphate aldolase
MNMLTSFKDLLEHALRNHYIVGYFEAWDLYSLEAVVEAAEDSQLPVILGFGGAMINPGWLDNGGIERLGALGLAAARNTKVPVALILNEVDTFSQVIRGIKAGFNAVMLDTSGLPFEENIAMTRKVVEVAHAVGVGVEAELGILPDASSEKGESKGCLTDPLQAAQFVSQTGVDALSVSIGNIHILTNGQAKIDCGLLSSIHKEVTNIPLVIHGGSGFPSSKIPDVIALGVAKVNIGTSLKAAFLNGLRDAISKLTQTSSIQDVMGSRKEMDVLQQGKQYMHEEVINRMKLWNPGFNKEKVT